MRKNIRVATIALLSLVAISAVFADEPTISITVYNESLGLVRELRSLDLDRGVQEYAYDGVAARIDPTSVHFNADGVQVLEQNFEYDLVGVSALTERYLGEIVDVQMADEVVRGTLLSADGGIIVQEDDGSVRMIQRDEVVSVRFPSLPDGLIIRPTLRWILNSEQRGTQDAELSYLTSGIRWEASYVAVLAEDDRAIDLAGWVQINNQSGATYENCRLKLMAGDVQVVQQPMMRMGGRAETYLLAGMDDVGFEEEEFFEYHLYTLPRLVTIQDRQTKQISLFPSAHTPAEKIYTYYPRRGDGKVEVSMQFDNSEEHNLGIPLPKGRVRMYKEGSDGSLEFIGEDYIDHTPRDETIRLTTGNAFDIVAEDRIDEQRTIGPRTHEAIYAVELRNRKDEDVEVVVSENFYGDWDILEQSESGQRIDAYTYEWTVPVPAGETVTLSYRVRTNR